MVKIRKFFFAINGNRAPGPDCFLATFFSKSSACHWERFYNGCLVFFRTMMLLKAVNTTIIVLVPKKKSPSLVGDFRPISCFNVIYQCITNILAKPYDASFELSY